MHKTLLSFLFTVLILSAAAQSQMTITGRAVNAVDQKPVGYATVTLYDDNGRIVTAVAALPDGRFSMRVKSKGDYRIEASMVGYRVATMSIHVAADVDAGSIKMSEGVEIESVEVTTRRSLIEQRSDRLVYDMSADPDAKHKNMSQMMCKIPLVVRSVESSKLTFEGEDIAEIYIDGKPNLLINGERQYTMDKIKGDVMSQVEVIMPNSPEYHNEKPIINIITSRPLPDGYAGNLRLTYSVRDNAPDASLDLVTKRNKFVIGATLAGNYSSSPHLKSSYEMHNLLPDAPYALQSGSTQMWSKSNGQRLELPMSYDISAKTYLSLAVGASMNYTKSSMLSQTDNFDADGNVAQTATTSNDNTNKTKPYPYVKSSFVHTFADKSMLTLGYGYNSSVSDVTVDGKTVGTIPSASLSEQNNRSHTNTLSATYKKMWSRKHNFDVTAIYTNRYN